jgi:hypothetical protein
MRRAVIAIVALLAGPAAAAEPGLDENARTSLAVTVYGRGTALIEDARRAAFAAGRTALAIEGVSPRLERSSPMIVAGGDVRLVAIDYDAELLTAETLLRRAVGREVDIVRTHPTTGEETAEPATVVAVEGGLVVRYRDRLETTIPGRIAFRDLPDDLRRTPTLVAGFEAARPVETTLVLSYLAGGLDWSTDYAAVVEGEDADGGRLAISGRAVVVNDAGIDLPNARLTLVAGEVRREQPHPPAHEAMMQRAAAAAPDMPAQEAFADLHLYQVPGTVTLPDRQTRQIVLFAADAVPFVRRYVSEQTVGYHAGSAAEPTPSHPVVEYVFENAEKAGLGRPLPAGIVRVYGRSSGSRLALIGEDRIGHTAVGGTVTLTPSQAFDIGVVRRQTDFKQIGGREAGVVESAWRIEIRNAKTTAVTVRLVEVMPTDWTMLSETAPHRRESARRVVWEVPVAPAGGAELDYRVRLQR